MTDFETIRTIACIGIPYVGGFLGSFAVYNNMEWYKNLKKPFLSPPAWVFAPAWTILYGCMGLASLLVLRESDNGTNVILPLSVYGAQLLLNWSWTSVYFGMKNFEASIAVILGTTFGAMASAFLFLPISSAAAYLMLPYIAWICFASYLNISTAVLNSDMNSVNDDAQKSKTH